MIPDGMARSLQDNVLTLALYSDKTCALVRNSVPINLFTSKPYRDILTRAYGYIDRYQKAPGDHIADELEDLLTQDNEQASLLADVLTASKELSETINEDYVVTQLEKFVRLQALKTGIVAAHEMIQRGDADAAEVELEKARKQRMDVFTPGLKLSDVIWKLENGEGERDVMLTGIDYFDRLGLGPAKKEIHHMIAPAKRGKSWWLTHMTKRGLLQRWKGVYITLELADKFVGRRELMSLFSVTSRVDAELTVAKFVKDEEGHLADLQLRHPKRPHIMAEGVLTGLRAKVEGMRFNDRLYIKEFPTGTLTLQGLEAYLDLLDRIGFNPDFLVIDMPQLMSFGGRTAADFRIALGNLMKGLRGVAVERNLALISAGQANRIGAGSRLVDETHAAEDWSQIGTVDCVMTYNQTSLERRHGLARIYVAAGRVEADRFSVLITQSYGSGQFVLDSMLMREEYWAFLQPEGDDDDDTE